MVHFHNPGKRIWISRIVLRFWPAAFLYMVAVRPVVNLGSSSVETAYWDRWACTVVASRGQDWPTYLSFKGTSSEALNLLAVYRLEPEAPVFRVIQTEPYVFFVVARRVWATDLRLEPRKTLPSAILACFAGRISSICT